MKTYTKNLNEYAIKLYLDKNEDIKQSEYINLLKSAMTVLIEKHSKKNNNNENIRNLNRFINKLYQFKNMDNPYIAIDESELKLLSETLEHLKDQPIKERWSELLNKKQYRLNRIKSSLVIN